MPPAYEVLLLNTAIPQIQAAQSGDTYVVPRDISFSAKALIGYTDYSGVGTNGLAVAGNVGIGTSSPGTKLHVSGVGRFARSTDATQYLNLTLETGNAVYNAVGGINHVWQNAGTQQMRLESSGTLNIVGAGSAGSTQAISFNGAAPVDSLVVAATTGNVGIGTSSPQAKLQVLDQIKISNAAQSQGALVLGDGGSTAFNVGIARWNGSTNAAGAGGLGYFTQGSANSGGHYWYTGDAQAGSTTLRMTLDTSGNLGIGTSSPGQKLTVNGDVSILGGNKLYLWNSTNTHTPAITSPSADVIAFLNNAGSQIGRAHV